MSQSQLIQQLVQEAQKQEQAQKEEVYERIIEDTMNCVLSAFNADSFDEGALELAISASLHVYLQHARFFRAEPSGELQ